MTVTWRRIPRLGVRRPLVVSIGLAGAAFLAGLLLLAVASQQAGGGWTDEVPYTRWDQFHYLSIADDGYTLMSCAEVPGYPPDEWCGNAGWYPGYPALIRALSALGLRSVSAALVISNAALIAVLALVAWLLRDRPIPDRLVCVVGAAWFPGAVFHRSAFPMSLALLGVLGALTALAARRWVIAGLLAAVAVVSYPQGLFVAMVAAPLLVAGLRRDREQLRTAAGFLGLVVLAGLAVFAVYEISTGRWDAWLLVQGKYHHTIHSPFGQWADRLGDITDPEARLRVPALQTALVLVTMVVVLAAAWLRRHRLDTFGLMVLAYSAVVWVFPVTLGPELSLYRAESLLLPVVLLLPLLPRWLSLATVAAWGVLFVPLSRLFFEGTLA